VIAPVIVGLLASVLLYVVFSSLFGPAAGVVALMVFGAIGFTAWLTTLILSAR
jgi:hypothetical protein